MDFAVRNPGGRPKQERAPRRNSLTPRLIGWRAHRARVAIGELAYELSVPPTGRAIWLELNVQVFMHNESLLEARATGPKDAATLEEHLEKIRTFYRRLMPKGNKFQRILRCEREVGRHTLADIRLVSLKAYHAHNHPYWDALAAQPSGYPLFWAYSNQSFLAMSESWGHNARERSPHEFVRPHRNILEILRQVDSLNVLRLYTALFGAAHSAGWHDIYSEAFDRMMRIACKIACVPPFASFSEEFAVDAIESTLSDGREPPDRNWRKEITNRIVGYKRLLQLAQKTDIVRPDQIFPTGRRDQMLKVLEFSDEVGVTELHMAMTAYLVRKKMPDLVRDLLDRIHAISKETSFFY